MSEAHETMAGATRRWLLKSATIGGCAILGLTGSALRFGARAAADSVRWLEDAFKQKSEADAVKTLYGKSAEASDKVKLEAPEIAENGAVVPISVASVLPQTTSIAILVLENPFTLAATYAIPDGTLPAVSNRLKMAKTTKVVALVEADGKLFSATKEVKVTVGGCGG
jgi:sulfur-oxidizing protein SoxY